MGIMVNVRQESEHATENDVSVGYSISSRKLSVEELHNASKSHGLVDSMHWQLDVGFREDKCRIRVDDRAEELSRIWQACFNFLKQETSVKGGIQRKKCVLRWMKTT